MTRNAPANGSDRALPGVFISYRRDLDAGWAPWLYDKLSDQFGANRIFMDLDSIAAGDDFVEVITRSVASCRVLIALIGKEWLDAQDAAGRRRLDDPADFVRLEIEIALRRGIRVIPLLIGGATMPAPAELPKTLTPIAHRQALTLTGTHRRYDAEHLVEAVKLALDQPPVEPIPPPSPAPPVPAPSEQGQLLASVQPKVARGVRGSSFEVRLTNGGPAHRSVVLRSAALQEGVHIRPDRVRVEVPAGETANTRIGVQAQKPLWWGRARDADVRIRVGVPDAVPSTLESRFRQRPFFGLPAMLAVLVFAVLTSIALQSRASVGDVVVPSVLTDEASARTVMQHAGLKVAVASAPSETVPKGKVIRTGPPAGARVQRGSVVTLFVSTGSTGKHTPSAPPSETSTKTAPAGCGTVPAVAGRSESAARSAIRDAGLHYRFTYRHSGSVDAGKVLSTKPGPGSSACHAVEVYVSTGPAPASCSISPRTGQSGSTVRMSCHGFADGESVSITWDGNDLTTMNADADGSLSTDVEIPGGFSGADYPGRAFTLRADGQRSGRHASANFTIEGTPSSSPAPAPSE